MWCVKYVSYTYIFINVIINICWAGEFGCGPVNTFKKSKPKLFAMVNIICHSTAATFLAKNKSWIIIIMSFITTLHVTIYTFLCADVCMIYAHLLITHTHIANHLVPIRQTCSIIGWLCLRNIRWYCIVTVDIVCWSLLYISLCCYVPLWINGRQAFLHHHRLWQLCLLTPWKLVNNHAGMAFGYIIILDLQ